MAQKLELFLLVYFQLRMKTRVSSYKGGKNKRNMAVSTFSEQGDCSTAADESIRQFLFAKVCEK